ncbi:phage tail tube protein [Pseudoroseomonas ludipueritiae]|uniref:Phage tail protein n=1 Tax=Pseudoroseomonas ludipueritiae TaxID=198093 RepID=A0ABR7R9X1_9PROT|nr:phage tail tube protein [Pseudoroseomonas ludipueritiae]MBC9178568.1 hypothetical protein [Pseudoroseomonas ludipueritiae]MCG7363194.1 phage tail tube protein [Roseomonas sp. ACRSG]
MASVNNGQAAVETTDVLLSYGVETNWGQKPAGNLKMLRITGESLTGQKQRNRPSEITRVRQVAKSVTQQKSAQGGFNFALSFDTFNDIFAALLGSTWTAPLAIDGVGGDITAVAAGNKLTSTTANKFQAVQVGQWIRLMGFSANGGANNGFARVSAKTSATDITLAGKVLVNETPTGTAAKIRGSMLRNDNEMQSIYFQKQTGTVGGLIYPGALITGASLQGGVGNNFTGSFNVLAKDQVQSDTMANATDAPTGGFHDAVANFGGCWLDDTPMNAALQNVSLELSREGAAMDYAMGSAGAAGGRWGQLQSGGQLAFLFKDYDLYKGRFDTEQQGRLAWATADDAGNAYIVEQLGATLMNPQIQAGGPNQAVVASYTVEGNPSQDAINRTIAIHRLPIS